jgi:putative DNA primase/helicase
MDIISRLKGVKRTGDGWTAICPAHEDKQSSLSVAHRDGKWLLKCHAGCTWEAVIAALGLKAGDLFDEERVHTPPNNTAILQRSAGLTLEQFAAEKQLPPVLLGTCGLSDGKLNGRRAVKIPYLGVDGTVAALRWRIAMVGDRFRWQSRSKPQLYGLNRLQEAREAGSVVLVEGESDCLTLWFHGIPAIGIPGAANWREDRDAAHLDGIDTIYAVIEPDRGGDTVCKWLAQSTIRHRVKLLTLPLKDPSAMHLADPDGFPRRGRRRYWGALRGQQWRRSPGRATPEAWDQCADWRDCLYPGGLDKDLSGRTGRRTPPESSSPGRRVDCWIGGIRRGRGVIGGKSFIVRAR